MKSSMFAHRYYKKAKLQAGIKLTVLCSAIDKENSTELPLDSVHYLYIKSNPNPFFYSMLPYESLFSRMSIDKKRKENKKKIIRKEKKYKYWLSCFAKL